MKRVLPDQSSGVEIMYPNLFRGLKLRPDNLTCHNSPLIRFDGKIIFPKG